MTRSPFAPARALALALTLVPALTALPQLARASTSAATALGPAGRWEMVPSEPSGRFGAATAYDPVRKRMWIFGGYDGANYLNELWSRTLTSPPTWTRLVPAGPVPSTRVQASLVYDAAHDRLVLFGGATVSTVEGDLWSLDLAGPPAWTPLSPGGTGPGPRYSHAALYDPPRDRMLVLGGADGSGLRGDDWLLDLSGPTPAWLPLGAAGTPPAARAYASVIYDPVGDRAVLFGGSGSLSGELPHPLNDTWTLALAGTPAWTPQAPAGTLPAVRVQQRASYDPLRGRMVVVGGYDGTHFLADAWTLDLAGGMTWAPNPFPGPLVGRMEHAQAWDPDHDDLVVFAGRNGSGILRDDVTLSPSGPPVPWPNNPLPRMAHKAVYDALHHDAVFFGGWYLGTYYNDVPVLHLGAVPTWSSLSPTGPLPAARYNQAQVYDPVGQRMILFGGNNQNGYRNDLWQLTLGPSPAWSPFPLLGLSPSPRIGMAGVYDPVRKRFLVVCGLDSQGNRLNETWALPLVDGSAWSFVPPGPTPPPGRYGMSVIYDPLRDRLVMFGGTTNELSFFNDTWAYSFAAGAWTQLAPAGTPPQGRYGHEAIYDPVRDRMVIFGGYGGTFRNDVWELTLGGVPTWSPLLPDGAPPSVRDFTASVYDPGFDRLILFGGNSLAGATAVPVSDTWALTWGDVPTPVLTTLVDETVDGARVHLAWYTPDGAGTAAQAERTADGTAWAPLGTLLADGSGRFTLDDVAPADGRWGYRLRVGARGTLTETTWLTTSTAVAALALAGATPNPAVTTSVVAFSLRGGMPASLAVFDVRGRAVLTRDLSRLGAGVHSLALARGELGGAGVYLLRLTEGDRSLVRKLALLP